MGGQPSSWGFVGSGKDAANHARTAGENAARVGWSAMRSRVTKGCHNPPATAPDLGVLRLIGPIWVSTVSEAAGVDTQIADQGQVRTRRR